MVADCRRLGPIVVILGDVLIWAIGWLTLERRTVAETVAFGSETTIGDSARPAGLTQLSRQFNRFAGPA